MINPNTLKLTTDAAPSDESETSPTQNEAGTSASQAQTKRPDPVRYGDWEIGGRCIDF